MAIGTHIRIVYMVGVAALGLAAEIPFAQAMVQEDTIVLGAVLSFEGHYQTGGRLTFDGYELAREQINSKGGVTVGGRRYQLEIRYENDKSTPAIAAEKAEQLIREDGILFMLGPYSSEMTKAVVGVTERYQIPLIAAEGASPSLFNRGNRYLFGLLSTADKYLDDFMDLASHMAKKQGEDPRDLRLAMGIQNDRFSLYVRRAVLAGARKCGIQTIIDEKLPKIITGMAETLKKVMAQKPDILVISGHAKGAETAARQLVEMQIRVPFLAITHCEAARINERYPEAVEGAYCPAQWAPTVPYADSLFGTAPEFAALMKSTYPEENYLDVPYQAAAAAAAVMVWKDAFERANSFDTERLRDVLSNTDLQTFYGKINFAPSGELISKPMVLRQIVGGNFVPVQIRFDPCEG
jgi:branched-chain amino acid transport system substrate-binding protein